MPKVPDPEDQKPGPVPDGATHPRPLALRAGHLVLKQLVYSGPLSFPLILAGTATSTAIAAGNAIGALAYGYFNADAFPDGAKRADLLRVTILATILYWTGLAIFIQVTQPDAFSHALSSHAARMMLIRVFISYPAFTLVGVATGLRFHARRAR